MTNICCICLEEIHTDCTPYTCSHIIHTHCANLWNKPCPLCKSNFKKSHIQFILGEIHGFEITLDKYQQLWDNSLCRPNHHRHLITISKPFGVVGKCSCGTIQCFNWMK